MRTQGKRGVTLVELLIAITLVSLLAAGLLTAMRVGLNAMDRVNDNLTNHRRSVGASRILEHQIAGLMPVATLCQPSPDSPPLRAAFFQGEPAAMRFVSAYSLQEAWRGSPRILEMVVMGRQGERGVRLVVNELLYTGPLSTGSLCMAPSPGYPGLRFPPVTPGPQSFVLADRLAYCSFQFLAQPLPSEPPRWVPRHSGSVYPLAIRIEMAPLEADPSRPPPTILTVRLRTTRHPLEAYADE